MTNINCPAIIQIKEHKNKYSIKIRRKKSSMYLAYVFLVESSMLSFPHCLLSLHILVILKIHSNLKNLSDSNQNKKYMLQTKAICKATVTT